MSPSAIVIAELAASNLTRKTIRSAHLSRWYRPGSVLFGRLPRQHDRKRGPTGGARRLEHQVAAHRPAQLAGDVQPQAAALVGPARLAADEALEQAGSIGGRDAL